MAKAKDEEVLGLDLPAKRDVPSIEDTLEALSDLAARRDVLRMIAQRALDEAEALQRLVDETIRSQQKQLASVAAQIGAR